MPHHARSPGIEIAEAAVPGRGLWSRRVRNAAASATAVALAWAAYRWAPHEQRALDDIYRFGSQAISGARFLDAGALLYATVIAGYFMLQRRPGLAKAAVALSVLWQWLQAPRDARARGLADGEGLALRGTLLKMFFGPMMALSLLGFSAGALRHGTALWSGDGGAGFASAFEQHGFWLVMQAILLVDVLVFTVGYLVELPQLGNGIRSVDPHWLGWTVALLCYPPFNGLTAAVMGSPVSDFPHFDNPTAHLALNGVLLLLMAVYAWATLALGFKASNLTHRGIVCHGPYAWIRHPAYACKNAAWWIGAAPIVTLAWSRSAWEGFTALASMLGWSLLYLLRALTEEDHLRGVDGDYAAYAQRVPRRFIPGWV